MNTLLGFLYLCIFATSSLLAQAPDLAWERTLGGSGFDIAAGHLATADGGYIILGSTCSIDGDLAGMPSPERRPATAAFCDLWLVKLDAKREIVWQKVIGGSAKDSAVAISHTRDGGYIITASTVSKDGDFVNTPDDTSITTELLRAIIIKVDSVGNIEWSRKLRSFTVYSIKEFSDGHFLFCAEPLFSNESLIGNLDPNGEIVWQKLYIDTGGAITRVYDIFETPQGFITTGIIGGLQSIASFLDRGQLLWEQRTGAYEGWQSSTKRTSDGGFVTVGSVTDSARVWYRASISLRTYDADGMPLTMQKYEDVASGYIFSIGAGVLPLDDDGAIISGVVDDTGTGTYNVVINRVEASGDIRWRTILGSTGIDFPTRYISQVQPGQYLFSYTVNGQDKWYGYGGPADIKLIALKENVSTVVHPAEGERLSISPNPVSTTLHVRLANPLLITITDLLGNTLRTYGERHGFMDIDVSNLASATYIITASDQERVVAREKFIKY